MFYDAASVRHFVFSKPNKKYFAQLIQNITAKAIIGRW